MYIPTEAKAWQSRKSIHKIREIKFVNGFPFFQLSIDLVVFFSPDFSSHFAMTRSGNNEKKKYPDCNTSRCWLSHRSTSCFRLYRL